MTLKMDIIITIVMSICPKTNTVDTVKTWQWTIQHSYSSKSFSAYVEEVFTSKNVLKSLTEYIIFREQI